MATETLKGLLNANNPANFLSTELNSLANNALVASSVGGASGVFSNVAGDSQGEGYPRIRLRLTLAAMTAPAAGSFIDGWFLCAPDGSHYEDGSSSITPARPPDFQFPLIAQTTQEQNQVVPAPQVALFKILLRNNATGQSLAASGNTLKGYYETDQLV